MRTGLLGGTFDPIHLAHLFIAECVRAGENLDRVLFVPVGDPAHRETHASSQERADMVWLAVADNPRFAVDSTALEQPGPVYTADSLSLLRAKFPDDEFYFIAGADSLATTPWRRLDEVAQQLAKFLVIDRAGVCSAEVDRVVKGLSPELRCRFEHVKLPRLDVSASELRARIKSGLPIRYLTPTAVAEYIERKNLYRS